MNECDKLNSFNSFVASNYKEPPLALAEPQIVANQAKEAVMKNQAQKEATQVERTGYSHSPAINQNLYTKPASKTQTTNSSTYNYGGYSTGKTTTTYSQANGNNLDYNTRVNKIRSQAREDAKKHKEYAASRGAGLLDTGCKYSFSVEKGKVKHHSPYKKPNQLFNKRLAKQAVVAAGIIIAEAALGLAMSEAKSGITNITNEVKNLVNNKTK